MELNRLEENQTNQTTTNTFGFFYSLNFIYLFFYPAGSY